ncbi:MAG: DNA-3-methyladenine glycosylase 2 family protein [Acidimicrobiia bacterium]|nr:DNA-3-methyladenine glycosylase 2 family protein [Acidimicrobiia bacterium]
MVTPSSAEQPVRISESAVVLSDHDAVSAEARLLAASTPLFAELLGRNGVPPLWRRPASFATLVRLVLEQQVSLASAQAAFRKLESRVADVTPAAILASTDEELKADGFSRQKAGYVRGIAHQMATGTLDLDGMIERPHGAYRALVSVRGIGPWTASCFLLFGLGLPDIWPPGDRALQVSIARNLELPVVPDAQTSSTLAAGWAPHRSVAARMLWHDYLGGRSYVPVPDAGFV